ncbi:MAG: helix-hairpin-helix domain-containing protein [Bacillota bacterium]
MKKVNINTADQKKLSEIKGIGRSKASNIVEYRKENGFFENVRELLEVKGIGEKLLALIKSKIRLKNGVKIVFDPDEYMLEDLGEVHLVGEMNDWDPADRSYPLAKKDNGCWEGVFSLPAGTEYKIMYDSDNWEAGKHIGDGYENFVVNG